ncbi:hypothetical protein G6F46_010882 [Rhizopus delemar]|nr:hypothetical protein G6F54_010639 [Rhizopus delemar]KAG1503316.1 hypothetical protein G6F53_010656 [Rhizopus delemar]KAG1604189.1 hypothetical protein G6F47_001143 [Rhizopus delemar]KAG1609318.1 hypothetical protein G6F46_010882 [Rhizopus delemar]KAG1630928.1 hypothetical protein G6F44_011195 [Rhizopus delemar]
MNDGILPPIAKLPRTYSKSYIKTAQRTSNDMKTFTKPIAAAGLEYNMEDQQESMILTDIINLMPIALLSESRSYYLFGNATDVQELHIKHPEVIFSIPPDPCNPPKDHEADYTLFMFLMNSSYMMSFLSPFFFISVKLLLADLLATLAQRPSSPHGSDPGFPPPTTHTS